MKQTLAYGHKHINVQVPDTIKSTCVDIPAEESQDEKLLIHHEIGRAHV